MLRKLLPLLIAAASPAFGQDTRTVAEPTFPPACTVLSAQMTIVNDGPAFEMTPNTARIQAALTACASGSAVELAASGSNYAFLSGPLNVPSGVSLIVDGGVTLFASRNREDYQKPPFPPPWTSAARTAPTATAARISSSSPMAAQTRVRVCMDMA